MDIQKIIKILEHYGDNAQKLKACEELSELQTVILQEVNKGANLIGIAEEIADVYIMLTQLELIYFIDPKDLREIIEYKLDRQIKRIENKC